MTPPVIIPPPMRSRATSLGCATCGVEISPASPIIFLMHKGLGRKMSVKVCWECADLHLTNPDVLEVQLQIMLSR